MTSILGSGQVGRTCAIEFNPDNPMPASVKLLRSTYTSAREHAPVSRTNGRTASAVNTQIERPSRTETNKELRQPRDPENASRDCMLFCVFGRTEVYEKTARPETYSPGILIHYLEAPRFSGGITEPEQ